MTAIKTFHTDKEEDMRMKQRSIAHDIAIVQRGDHPRVTKVVQQSKPKHVSFEDVEDEAENYDRITEEITNVVQKEKTSQTTKIKNGERCLSFT